MIRLFIFALILIIPNMAHAQFDFLGAAQKILTASKPILTESGTTTSSSNTATSSLLNSLSTSDMEGALRQVLSLSAAKVTNQLGSTNGFYGDNNIKIPLPGKLQTAHQMLSKVGLESLGNDLELKMNRAAEMAMPQAKTLFLSSIEKMTVNDAKNILMGGDDSATQFFQNTMSGDLINALTPIIATQLDGVQGMQTYNQLVQQYANIPFAPKMNMDLPSYVANMAADGMFTYMASEEAAIRANPVERSTALLQRVFSAYQ